jgi:hypothetical protein
MRKLLVTLLRAAAVMAWGLAINASSRRLCRCPRPEEGERVPRGTPPPVAASSAFIPAASTCSMDLIDAAIKTVVDVRRSYGSYTSRNWSRWS